MIDNPIYCGKIAYGRRKNEKIPRTRNQYQMVRQKEYPVYDGIHEAIISESDWLMAQKKRGENKGKREKLYSLDHEHLLSGILVCPVCGSSMYGNVNRKRKADGSMYKDQFYYVCKHRKLVDGRQCEYRRQWRQERINGAVEEVVKKLVNNPRFEEAIRAKINTKIDTTELDKELEGLQKKLRQLNGSKNKLSQQLDTLDVMDLYYGRKYQDMQNRLDTLYIQIGDVEENISTIQERIHNIKAEKIHGDNVYAFLQYYCIMYDRFNDAEKKEFMKVEIYNEPLASGQLLKKITFSFPVFYDGQEISTVLWDEKDHVETVVMMSRVK